MPACAPCWPPDIRCWRGGGGRGGGGAAEGIRHAALLGVTTCGFPAAIAGFGWIDEVLKPQ